MAQAEAYATEGKGGGEDFTMSIPRAWQRRERQLKRPIRRAGESEAEWMARRRISHRGKTLRAFRAYLDLLDTAAYMQNELSTQLAAFDVTMRGLRVLEML